MGAGMSKTPEQKASILEGKRRRLARTLFIQFMDQVSTGKNDCATLCVIAKGTKDKARAVAEVYYPEVL